ncbi:N-acetylmuramoyl-L-alanine amidase-like isoform X2 [Vidua chalybeata]|uniref:N-acetylmuramoyl-L-alanine amidase-like isoform X2 n=1 Tax=Vidua chalybeata TaxID=81927 RepID=UPI0023A8DD71|nr:N-acetylmuramoyl-L-alanine amidase-like isoform X2 [Vidua chalybeata]
MCEELQPELNSDLPPENPHWAKTLQVWRVWKELQDEPVICGPGDPCWEDPWLGGSTSSWAPHGYLDTSTDHQKSIVESRFVNFHTQKNLTFCIFWWHQATLDGLGGLFQHKSIVLIPSGPQAFSTARWGCTGAKLTILETVGWKPLLKSFFHPWCPRVPQGVLVSCRMFLWLLLALSVCTHPGRGVSPAVSPIVPPRHMDSVLDILDALESPARGGSPGTAAALGRGLGVCSTPGCRAVLGEPLGNPERPPALTLGQWQLLTELLHHDPATPELGAVLTPDGSTVALGPLLAGIEAGLRSGGFGRPLPTLDPPADPLLAVTIAEALGTSFLLAQGGDNNATALGPGGCWDDVENPQNYTLRGPPSPVPDPVAIGAMDGTVLGARLAQGPLPVAELLRGYYGTGNGSEAGRPPSSYRRRDFGALAGQGRLEKEVAAVLGLLRTLSPTSELLRDMGTQEVAAVARRAAREFSERYVECPAIVPRCLWGAHPYRGTPALLQLPLSSVFLHHTLEPSQPCRTFGACAHAMRNMQRFHQDTRGWDDIGYSEEQLWPGWMEAGEVGQWSRWTPAQSGWTLVQQMLV